jgi:hypothetical protein
VTPPDVKGSESSELMLFLPNLRRLLAIEMLSLASSATEEYIIFLFDGCVDMDIVVFVVVVVVVGDDDGGCFRGWFSATRNASRSKSSIIPITRTGLQSSMLQILQPKH